MATRALTEYLDNNDIYYHCYNHSPAVTAAEVAQSSHIPGRHMAKTVIVDVDGSLAMAVLPADQYMDPEKLRQALNAGLPVKVNSRIASRFVKPVASLLSATFTAWTFMWMTPWSARTGLPLTPVLTQRSSRWAWVTSFASLRPAPAHSPCFTKTGQPFITAHHGRFFYLKPSQCQGTMRRCHRSIAMTCYPHRK
ncbi:MAG: aminoacyl-tRNA deacylase [Alcanivorax nanhaiticus]